MTRLFFCVFASCLVVPGLAFQSRPSTRVSVPALATRKQTSRLFQSPLANPPPRKNPLRNVFQKVNSFRSRVVTRFRALPTRAKRIVIAQWLVMFLAFGAVGKNAYMKRAAPPAIEIPYSRFLDLIEQQKQEKIPIMDQVRISTDRIIYRLYPSDDQMAAAAAAAAQDDTAATPTESLRKSRRRQRTVLETQPPRPFVTAYTRKVPAAPELVTSLRSQNIGFTAAPAPRTSSVAVVLRSAMAAFYFLILFRLYRTVSSAGGGNKKDVPGKLASDLPLASFDEIQGMDGVKNEVMELVDTLRNPDKYAILGARAPTGLLLEGPPGTGKTMLARATAATAGVPLIYCSGSDFVEMFVGRGAARVRNLFEKASKLAPCILFIDELDALGKARDAGGNAMFTRSNDEAEQTLNQLLACMDGLDSRRGICVLAATNRRDVLDKALIRPGRFDRIVRLELPNKAGREAILRVHCRKLPGFVEGTGVDPDRLGALGKGRCVDLSAIAAMTDGFSGAELEFLVNEAAIRAVRRVSSSLQQGTSNKDITPHVQATDFEESLVNFVKTRRPNSAASIFKNVFNS